MCRGKLVSLNSKGNHLLQQASAAVPTHPNTPPSLHSENYYTPEELATYREQRERARIAEERRQAELQALREQLAERRRQQQNL